MDYNNDNNYQNNNMNTNNVDSNQKQSSGVLGILSLICGIACIMLTCTGVFGVIFGVMAIIFGCIEKKHEGVRIGGIVTGIIGLLLSIMVILVYIFVFEIGKVAISELAGQYDGMNVWDAIGDVKGEEVLWSEQLSNLNNFKLVGLWKPAPSAYYLDAEGNYVSEDYEGEKQEFVMPNYGNSIWEFDSLKEDGTRGVTIYLNDDKTDYVRGTYVSKTGIDGFKMLGYGEIKYNQVKETSDVIDENIFSVRITPTEMIYKGEPVEVSGPNDYIWIIGKENVSATVCDCATGNEYKYEKASNELIEGFMEKQLLGQVEE